MNLNMNNWIKYNLTVDDWDKLIAILFYNNLEELGPGNFCDVGACDGVYTTFFNSIDPESKVFSFELNPYNFEKLKSLRTRKCIIENMAISNIDGDVNFFSDNSESGNHLSNITGYDTNNQKMRYFGKIKSTKLDTYFKNIKVDYIKIDVEGAELDVIKGGVETLRNCKFAVIECHHDKDWQNIVNFCKSEKLNFKNIVDDVPIYYSENVIPTSGLSSVGRTYQMYIKNIK